MTSLPPSRLGFGTGLPALGGVANAVVLLETALDCGVRCFDTAPLYLWGAAEPLLGQLAARRRDEMIIVTKAGMRPPTRLARLAARAARVISPQAAAPAQSGLFKPAQVSASIDASLRALNTDHVDALLLHEVRPQEMNADLARALEEIKRSGKTRALGLATSAASANAVLAAYPGMFDIVQTTLAEARAVAAGPHRRIVHSVLSSQLEKARTRTKADAAYARRLSEQTGVDPLDRARLGQLLLRAAMAFNRDGVTLFSSTDPNTIKVNAALEPLNEEQAGRVSKLLEEL